MEINQQAILDRFKTPQTNIRSERAEIIKQFVDGINIERINTKYKPVTPRAVAIKLGHIKDKRDLYYFLKKCQNADSFGKCFFGCLKCK